MRDDDFERLFATHAQRLLQFLTFRLGHRQTAEDILAETFERVLRARRPFSARRGGASEKTWLYTIALNLARDHGRRRAVEQRVLAQVGAGQPAAERTELDAVADRDELRRAMTTLSPEEREAVSLRYGADLTVPEIAKLLGVPLTTAEARVYRGLRRMRDTMGG